MSKEASFYIEKSGSTFCVYGHYDEGDPGDQLTAPVMPSFEISRIEYKDVDVYDLLNSLGVDLGEISEDILEKYL